MDRRDAIKTMAGIGAGLALAPLDTLAQPTSETSELSDKVAKEEEEQTEKATIKLDPSGKLKVTYDEGHGEYSADIMLYGLHSDGISIEGLNVGQMDDNTIGIMRSDGRPFRLANTEDNAFNQKHHLTKVLDGEYLCLYLTTVRVHHEPTLGTKIGNPCEWVSLAGHLMGKDKKIVRFGCSNAGEPDWHRDTYPLKTQHPVIELIRQVADNRVYDSK